MIPFDNYDPKAAGPGTVFAMEGPQEGIEIVHSSAGKTWTPTFALRWHPVVAVPGEADPVSLSMMTVVDRSGGGLVWELQQLWACTEDGSREWRPIPRT